MMAALTGEHPITIDVDKGYDTKEFVRFMGWQGVTYHRAGNTKHLGGSAIDRRTSHTIQVTTITEYPQTEGDN